MRPDDFVRTRQADWAALSALIDRCQGSLVRLSPDEVQTLGRLYRAATSDLALAQRDFGRHRVADYLNQLVARAHAVVYRGEPLGLRRFARFVTHGFPQTFRRLWAFILAAGLLLLLPAVLAGVLTYTMPAAATQVLPAGTGDMVEMLKDRELWTNIPISQRPYVSSFVMTNNIQVSFLAFAGGMTAGLFTVWIMIVNGLLLGGISGLAFHYGVGWELWEFVIGHGVIELSVIAMAGGAGLRLGWAILRPGLLRRRDALADAARQAVRLVIGCVPVLILAGLIEGFISPNDSIPPAVKWVVGLGTGAALYGYCVGAGRNEVG